MATPSTINYINDYVPPIVAHTDLKYGDIVLAHVCTERIGEDPTMRYIGAYMGHSAGGCVLLADCGDFAELMSGRLTTPASSVRVKSMAPTTEQTGVWTFRRITSFLTFRFPGAFEKLPI